jgi:hypothetical protein
MPSGKPPRLVMGIAIPREAGDSARGSPETREESAVRMKAGEMYISNRTQVFEEGVKSLRNIWIVSLILIFLGAMVPILRRECHSMRVRLSQSRWENTGSPSA